MCDINVLYYEMLKELLILFLTYAGFWPKPNKKCLLDPLGQSYPNLSHDNKTFNYDL